MLLFGLPVYADHHLDFLGAEIPKVFILKKTNEKIVLQGYAANYQEENLLYVGALFSSKIEKESSVLLLSDLSMAMIFFFLEDDIPVEKIARMFSEEVSINTPALKNDPINVRRLQELQSVFQNPFQAGDKIVFEYTSNDELSVYLNDLLVVTWKNSRSFFNALLRMWIGAYPPSRGFKEGILGQ